MADKLAGCLTCGQARPLNRSKGFRYIGPGIWRLINHDRDNERDAFRHVVCAVNGEFPLAPKIPFGAGFCIRGDDRDEKPAVVNTLADLPVPGIPAA